MAGPVSRNKEQRGRQGVLDLRYACFNRHSLHNVLEKKKKRQQDTSDSAASPKKVGQNKEGGNQRRR